MFTLHRLPNLNIRCSYGRLLHGTSRYRADFIAPSASLPLAGVKFVPHNTPAFPALKLNNSLMHRYSEDSPHRDKTSSIYVKALFNNLATKT
jgi:hypothetical protein